MSGNGTSILLVSADQQNRNAISASLSGAGFCVEAAPDCATARQIMMVRPANIILLDTAMPSEDDMKLCDELRKHTGPPVIVLSSAGDDRHRIAGLESGADDYLVKPFNPAELIARIKAVLRRTGGRSRRSSKEFAGWTLFPEHAELRHTDGRRITVSSGEMALLGAFLEEPDQTLSRNQLMEKARGREAHPFERSIDNMISRLRRKIEKDPKNPRIIKTVWGGGYVLVTSDTS